MTEPHWHTSSYSGHPEPNCVEVAQEARSVKIRDTQHRHLGHMEVPASAWGALLGAVRRGELA
jgi:hypothetical protein